MNQNQKKAILFFSRTAEEEARHKRFHDQLSYKGNVAIGKNLIDSTLETLASTNIPLISCFSSQQVGESFGERLTNAVEDVFASGYDQVMVVGNDCPFINESLVIESFESINQGQVVLGPAKDGGVYLLGLDKTHFNKHQFAELAWMQSDLQESLKEYVTELSAEIQWLEEHSDIDSISDFSKLLKLLPKFSLLRIQLTRIISDFIRTSFALWNVQVISHLKFTDLNLRGPPIYNLSL